ncbi:MAG: glycosyltransferase family 1 protein, partial [Thermodesulfobacteriota bacterium]|nr:glycosyltransferase family 1 protein [Thermodesulfobacteriota bacterium]
GILIPPGDPKALASAIINILNNKEFGERLGIEAKRRVKKEFSVAKMVSETERVYLSLLRNT